MSAAELRQAAAVMRERAEAAIHDSDGDRAWSVSYLRHVKSDEHGYEIVNCGSEQDAKHIASWHPAVALAVADWLDDEARHVARNYATNVREDQLDTAARHALAVARIYLGSAS